MSDEARRGRQVTSREPADADAYYSRAIAADPSHGPSYGFKALLLVRQIFLTRLFSIYVLLVRQATALASGANLALLDARLECAQSLLALLSSRTRGAHLRASASARTRVALLKSMVMRGGDAALNALQRDGG